MTNARFSGTHRLSKGSAVTHKISCSSLRLPQLHKDTSHPEPFLSLHFQAVGGTNTNTTLCLYGILQLQRHSPTPKLLSTPTLIPKHPEPKSTHSAITLPWLAPCQPPLGKALSSLCVMRSISA